MKPFAKWLECVYAKNGILMFCVNAMERVKEKNNESIIDEIKP